MYINDNARSRDEELVLSLPILNPGPEIEFIPLAEANEASSASNAYALKVIYNSLMTTANSYFPGISPPLFMYDLDDLDIYVPQLIIDMRSGRAPSVEQLMEQEGPRPIPALPGYCITPFGEVLRESENGTREVVPHQPGGWGANLVYCEVEHEDGVVSAESPAVFVFSVYTGCLPTKRSRVVPIDLNPFNCRLDNLALLHIKSDAEPHEVSEP
jgi:hypothetical protein